MYKEIYQLELDYIKTNWVGLIAVSNVLFIYVLKGEVRASPIFADFVKGLFPSQDSHVSNTWLEIVQAISP
jgi:hypothetical protein